MQKKNNKDNKNFIIRIGTGGSYVLDVLTRLGFDDITIADSDKVEQGNIGAQNYSNEDVRNFKTDFLIKKYPNAKIKALNKNIKSDSELQKLVSIEKIDYFINCADDFELLQSI